MPGGIGDGDGEGRGQGRADDPALLIALGDGDAGRRTGEIQRLYGVAAAEHRECGQGRSCEARAHMHPRTVPRGAVVVASPLISVPSPNHSLVVE